MASIGLRRFRNAPLTTEADKLANCLYGKVGTLAGAIECKVKLDISEAELRADDIVKEQASSVTKGTITMGVDEADDAIFAPILGQTVSKVTVVSSSSTVDEYTSKSDDIAVPQGFGHIVPKVIGGNHKFKVEWFPKVVFKPFIPDSKTKGDKLEFTTPSIEGTIYCLADGTYEKHCTFDSETDAQTYLDSLFKQSV